MEAFGTVLDVLCISRKHYSVAVFLQPQALLPSSWPSPWMQPTAHRGTWLCGLVCTGVPEPTLAHFYFPRLPAKVFPLHSCLVLCVLLWHPLSHFSLQFLNCCKVLKLQVIVNFVPQQPRGSCWGPSAPAVSQLWFLKPVLAWGGVGSGLCCSPRSLQKCPGLAGQAGARATAAGSQQRSLHTPQERCAFVHR